MLVDDGVGGHTPDQLHIVLEFVGSKQSFLSMTIDSFLDFLGVRLNGPKADGKNIKINFDFTDTGQQYALGVENSAVHYTPNKKDPNADATIILTRSALNDIILGTSTIQDQIKDGTVKIEGNPEALNEFIALLDNFELWFNIVTP